MKLSCIHCGNEFSISADQLGRRGRCPHCKGVIQLPKAESDQQGAQGVVYQPINWLDNSLSGMGSFVFHLALALILALIPFGSPGLQGEGEDVFIGSLPSTQLDNNQEGELTAEEVEQDTESENLDDNALEDIQPPTDPSNDPAIVDVSISPPSPSGGASIVFNPGAPNLGGGVSGSGNWDGMIQTLRQNGLDIVISFDSTGSMRPEIDQVKSQIRRIGNTLIKLVPKARISICTYRDVGEDYVVKGLPLTNDIQAIDAYLSKVYASAGGDHPEAVQEGLRWPVANNQFRPRARKVILLFGDAPPHEEHRTKCLELASDFSSQQTGIVSTVTCHSENGRPLAEFVEIAKAGRGEAFLSGDERQIMTQLLVLVFGSKYRDKVIEAFKLLDR